MSKHIYPAISVIVVLFIYWLAGGAFERGPLLGLAAFVSTVSYLSTFATLYGKPKRRNR